MLRDVKSYALLDQLNFLIIINTIQRITRIIRLDMVAPVCQKTLVHMYVEEEEI